MRNILTVVIILFISSNLFAQTWGETDTRKTVDTINERTSNGVLFLGDFNFNNSTTIQTVKNEDDFLSNSDSALATQQSIKVYVDNKIDLANKELSVFKNADTLYISAKYQGQNDSDLVYVFVPCMQNALMTLRDVGLIANTGEFTITMPNQDIDLYLQGGGYNTRSDNVGPLRISGASDFIGGNHALLVSSTTLSGAYNSATDAVMPVTDGSIFDPTGGITKMGGSSETVIYTGVSGNTLTGCSGNLGYSYAGTEAVDARIKTANMQSYSVMVDNASIIDNYRMAADSVKITVTNYLFDARTLTYSVQDTALIEVVTYVVHAEGVEVYVTHEYTDSYTVQAYYGMQSIAPVSGTSEMWDNVYYAHGTTDDLETPSTNTSSGLYSAGYEDCEKVIYCDDGKNHCQQMALDRNTGLGADFPNNWDAETNPIVFRGTAKAYYNLMLNEAVTSGQTNSWHGTYSWFADNSEGVNTLFATQYYQNGKKEFSVDFKGAQVENFTNPSVYDNHIEEIRADAGVSSVIGSLYIAITATGIGNIDLGVTRKSNKILITENWGSSLDTIFNLNAGPVGIGTDSPTKKLEVNGDLKVIDDIYLDANGVIYEDVNTLLNWKGTDNYFLGREAGNTTLTGNGNIGQGYQCLNDLTDGTYNIGIGYNSFPTLTTGDYNIGVGFGAGRNSTGSYNIDLGYLAGEFNGTHNVNIGESAGRYSTGDNNVRIGRSTGFGFSSNASDRQTAVGAYALRYNQGDDNTALGYQAGGGTTLSAWTGTGNVFIGYQVAANLAGTVSDELWIDASDTNTPLIHGDFSTDYILINGNLGQKVYTDDVSNPPTDAELDAIYGTPATVGTGFTSIIDDNGGGANFYRVVSDGTNWWIFTGTKAL